MSITDGKVVSMQRAFHAKFNEGDGDLIVVSSDNIGFRLHSKFIQSDNANGLQLAIAESNGELRVEEPASILEILFGFLYPRRFPSLIGMDFETLIQLAEAAEKFQIFSVCSVCEIPLMAQVGSHPIELFKFGLKHDYPDLTNEAARHLSRIQKPLDEILDELPEETRIAWVRYDQAWKLVFRKGRQFLPNAGCQSCIAVLERWWEEIEGMPIEKLDIQTDLSDKWIAALELCKWCFANGTKSHGYQQSLVRVKDLLKALPDHIKEIPTFMAYMETRCLRATEIKQLTDFDLKDFVIQRSMKRFGRPMPVNDGDLSEKPNT